jgi:hypothetical protein
MYLHSVCRLSNRVTPTVAVEETRLVTADHGPWESDLRYKVDHESNHNIRIGKCDFLKSSVCFS